MLTYTVRPGDTLSSIARRFGLPANRVAADNSLRSPQYILPGQNLLIMSDEMLYTIREGQTLYSLSQEYGVPLDRLIAANPGLNPLALRIGQTVVIPVAEQVSRRPAIVNGYAYPSIDNSALNCVLPFLTFISPFSYSITAEGGIIAPAADEIIYRAVRSAVMPLMVVTNIYDGAFSTEALSRVLYDEERRERLISSILRELQSKDYYGLNLDMEYIAPADRQAYNAFLRTVADRVHERGCILVTALAPKISAEQKGLLYEAHDYPAQGAVADYVILMTYEWGYTYGPPLAVSPINEVRRVLDYAVSEMPSGKILMGMPNYGYDWTLPYMRGTAARSLGFVQATELALKYGAEIRYDEKSQTPYFNYTTGGEQHVVWFDDPRSIDAKLRLVDEYELAGVSWWTVNRCYPPAWLIGQSLFETLKL